MAKSMAYREKCAALHTWLAGRHVLNTLTGMLSSPLFGSESFETSCHCWFCGSGWRRDVLHLVVSHSNRVESAFWRIFRSLASQPWVHSTRQR